MSKTVLFVEDETDLRDGFIRAVERSGWTAAGASDGQEAVERIDAGPVFDVVLSDIQMPRLGGEEVLAHVRKCSPNTSVVMITAYRNDESVVRYLANGAMDYLTKPVERKSFVLFVSQYCGSESPQPVAARAGSC